MKRLPNCILALLLMLYFPVNGAFIFVSTKGSDAFKGSADSAFATLNMALRKARELRRLNDPSIADGIHIILKGGRYQLNEPVFIRPEDEGTAASPTFIESEKNGKAVLSGGLQIRNWKRLEEPLSGLSPAARGKVWVADLPTVGSRPFDFRQLWVNNNKAVRAKDVNGAAMNRILGWNKNEQTCWIATPKFPGLANVQGLEFFIHQWWAIAILRVKKMEVHGDSTKLFFNQPESRIQSEHPWPAPFISKETGNSGYLLGNALQFLDEPGEWFLDHKNQKLYYWPRSSENLSRDEVIAPFLETLVKVTGTNNHAVSHLVFDGISFSHTGWLRPSLQGHVPHQNGLFMTDGYKLKPAGTSSKPGLDNQAWIGRPAAAVEMSRANSMAFKNCRFEHLASTGLDINIGVHQNSVSGNLFRDIGGTAILAGVYSDEATEIHLPFLPRDDQEICDGLTISNNLITDVANEDWSCIGIGVGYSRNTVISHNEIENVPYSGISMGWGWNAVANPMKNNAILSNKIHHFGKHNYDCGGIYTLGNQPGSRISDNYIDSVIKAPYAHLPSHWFYLYADEGSSNFTVTDNWTPSEKFLQNSNGPGNTWSNNGPMVNRAIRERAGLEDAFKQLLDYRTAHHLKLPINEQHPELIELVVKEGQTLNLPKLKQLLGQNKIDSTALYQWQNHVVIFAAIADVGVMQSRIQNAFPEADLRVYHDLFYEFKKSKRCRDSSTAAQWDHVILTANLVADKKMQQQYLDYHATQFEKWPELSNGFCNADFQQLLIFKNGRQLMLVISIPKGASLDALNPKTTENNPRVVQWNTLMKKYQEGITGTQKGETWVFLKKLKE